MIENGSNSRSDSLTELLARDHRRLDAILAAAKLSLHSGDMTQGAARFSEFRDGLERHIVVEEGILFPMFETLSGGTGGGPIHVMRQEHKELRTLMAQIASALVEGSHEDGGTTPLAALTARIHAHNGKEERILYPAIERAARDADALEALLRRISLEL